MHKLKQELNVNNELMSIRAMCDAFDVTPRTLRFYEQKELLSPIREGQKRLFTRRDRARLTLILRGRKFGISLEEIRQLLDLYDISEHKDDQLVKVIEAARRRLAEMMRQRDELDLSISELSDHIENGEQLVLERKNQSAA